MADDAHDTIDKSEAPARSNRTPLVLPLLAIALGLAGTVVMFFALLNGIPAALDGSGNGAGGFIPLFFVGAAMAVAAIVLGIVGLVRGGRRILSALALVTGLLPVLLVLLVAALNLMTVCCAPPPH